MPPQIYRITSVRLYFIPVQTRVPLKFGSETLTSVTCARVALGVVDDRGREAEGWGETPLSVQWVWPSSSPYDLRHRALKSFCELLAASWMGFRQPGHAFAMGFTFQKEVLPSVLAAFNRQHVQADPHKCLPWLAALVCTSPFDLALH